jgi:predicted lipoprotein
LLAAPAAAQDHAAIAARAVDGHVLPGYATFAAATAALAAAADAHCGGTADRAALDTAYHAAFDGWMGVSHLRFGPVERLDRAFSIAFWPDARGAGPRALSQMLATADPVVDDPFAFAEASVAVKGLFALDWLLFDPAAEQAEPVYRCRLIVAIARDLAANAAVVAREWRDDYADRLRTAGAPTNVLYTTGAEATRTLYGAVTGGLDSTLDLRVGRPLGGEGPPQPRRAEAWRSGRPLRNIALSIDALEALTAAFLPEIPPPNGARVTAGFAGARAAAAAVPPPLTAAVGDPRGRPAVLALQAALRVLRETLASDLGGPLGVTLGFNALDGD